MAQTLKQKSRSDYNETPNDFENIKLGCLQRIADATETVAENYNRLIRENNDLKNLKQFWIDRNNKLEKRIAAYKGQITKLKKKQQTLK